jgi:hypothetical protein
MFTTLTVDEMMSIVLAAPPGTATHYSRNGGWTTTDHLLATMSEYQAGLVTLSQRIARPGVTDLRPSKLPDLTGPGTRKVMLDSMTIDEYEQRRKTRTKRRAR